MSTNPRCVHCGAPLTPGQPTCGQCQAVVIGAQASVKVPVFAAKRPTVPEVCCCCLAPKELDTQEKVYVAPKRFFMTSVPWCQGCRSRANRAMAILVVAMFAFGFGLMGALMAVAKAAGMSTDGGYGLGALGFIVGLIVGAVLSIKIGKARSLPGHVAQCSAVGSMPGDGIAQGGPGGHLTFHNAVFARLWHQQNS